jgi:predicted phage tail protein
LIVDGSLRVVYSLGTRKEEDGVEIEYRDPVSYQPDYALYPASAIRPRRIRLIGCTDITEAEKRAEFLWKQEQYSRFVWSLDSELDALVLMPGDTIEITPKGQSPKLCVVSEVRHAGGNRSSVVAFEYDARAYS